MYVCVYNHTYIYIYTCVHIATCTVVKGHQSWADWAPKPSWQLQLEYSVLLTSAIGFPRKKANMWKC